MYVGRFAPSPTGPLHFGSLIAALGSWLDARSARGAWLLRIEDLDWPREQPGAAAEILSVLEACGLNWDGEIVLQSRRNDLYRAALERLREGGATYACACTRREIADSAPAIDGARVYPGTCRAGLAEGRAQRAVRVRTTDEPVIFEDRLFGRHVQSVGHEVGDFVLWRADGLFAYQLAVVVDDAAQGVTDVVRGADLIDSTARQIHLQRLLGLPTPRYLHLPVAVNASGEKLSKQTRAKPVDPACAGPELVRAFVFLGHPPPAEIAHAPPRDLLDWGARNWDPARIPKLRAASD
ncbi:MAG: tRNA glutamyl-Q(34) synthetase GluQRS [Betaproteobacteria bacterium]|nr:tRNA glutamyl-Q(34) synthetase GluQRS [Betaproteobacteria bacterium]